jgi:ubiquinone/menaquinone biosynthesis C-methylase UbiE
VAFESHLYPREYFESLHPAHWFRNPPRKYAERNRDALRLLDPEKDDVVVELGCARGDLTFLLAPLVREVIGVDASGEALAMAETERVRRGVQNIRWLKADVANLSALPDASANAVAAIDLVEHIDDPTLETMLTECHRILVPGGRLAVYTPDRAHYVERLKAHDLILKQFPQHIAVRRAQAYVAMLKKAGLAVAILGFSVSPFPVVRRIEKLLAPLPFIGPTFRYRILIRGVRP